MSEEETPASTKVWDALHRAARGLNEATAELQEVVAVIDKKLGTLNIGLPTWVHVPLAPGAPLNSDRLDLGYVKCDNVWGLAIRLRSAGHPDGIWRFGSAPRPFRIKVLGEIPALLEGLFHNTVKTTARMREATVLATSMADAITTAMLETETTDGSSRRRDAALEGAATPAGAGSETLEPETPQDPSPAAVDGRQPGGDGVRSVSGHRYTPLRSRLVRKQP